MKKAEVFRPILLAVLASGILTAGSIFLALSSGAASPVPQAAAEYNRGLELAKAGDYEGAIGAYSRAIQLDPSNPSYYFSRGNSKKALGFNKDAIQDYDRAIELRPSDPSPFINRGIAKYQLADHRGAIADYTQALALDPQKFNAYKNRALSRQALGDRDGAVADMETYLKAKPDDTAVRDALTKLRNRPPEPAPRTPDAAATAEVLWREALARTKAKDFAGAVEAYNKAIALTPGNATLYYNRANNKRDLKDYPGAIDDYDSAVRIDPGKASSYLNRGYLKELMGDPDAAAADYEKCLSLSPDHDIAKQGVARVAQLRIDNKVKEAEREVEAGRSEKRIGSPAISMDYLISKKSTLPAERMNSGTWPSADAVWKKVEARRIEIASDIPPAECPPPLDMLTVTRALYTAAVSTAMEGMRLVFGPMTAVEVKNFEWKWAPLFDFPFQAAINYLNELNPLLAQFLAVRAALAQAAADYDALWEEATVAAGLEDGDAVAEAMGAVGLMRNKVAMLEARLAKTAEDIRLLGDPPNPVEEKARRRKNHKDTVREVGKIARRVPSKLTGSAGGSLKIVRWELFDTQIMTRDGGTVSNTDKIFIASFPEREVGEKEKIVQITWPGPPSTLIPGERIPCPATYIGSRKPVGKIMTTPGFIWDGLWAADYQPDVDPYEWVVPSYEIPDLKSSDQKTLDQTALADAKTAITFANSYFQVSYIFQGILAKTEDLPPETITDGGSDKAEKLEFYQANIAYFERYIESLNRERATAPSQSLDELDWQIMCAQANIQGEQDKIEMLETGQWVRTRTAFDDFCLNRMIQIGQEEARESANKTRLILNNPRLVALLPELERRGAQAELSALITKAVSTGDYREVKQKTAALADRVQNYWGGEAKRNLSDAWWADMKLHIAQGIKTAADITLMGASFGAGAPGSFVSAGNLIYSAYLGATGYVEGGPAHAVKEAVSGLHAVLLTGIKAYDGYNQAVIDQKTGKPVLDPATGLPIKAGISGALWEGGKVALMAFTIQKVVPWIAKKLGVGGGAAGGEKWLTVEAQLHEAQFQRALAQGRMNVRLFQQRQARLNLARNSGAAPAEIEALNRQAEEAAMLIKLDYASKVHLNQLASGGDRDLLRGYLQHEQSFMGRVFDSFRRRMHNDNWGDQPFRTFSNSASCGRAGMDIDYGVNSPARYLRDENGIFQSNPEYFNWLRGITQNGRRRSSYDLEQAGQRHLEDAFAEVVGQGRNTREAFVNFTTPGHSEAYADQAWIGAGNRPTACFDNIDPRWVQQAADVTMFKVNGLPAGHPALPHYLDLQEKCRTLVKDINTKLAGINPLAPGRVGAGSPLAAANQGMQDHIMRVRNIMDDFANNRIGPIQAERALNEMTGGEGLPSVVREFGDLLVGMTRR